VHVDDAIQSGQVRVNVVRWWFVCVRGSEVCVDDLGCCILDCIGDGEFGSCLGLLNQRTMFSPFDQSKFSLLRSLAKLEHEPDFEGFAVSSEDEELYLDDTLDRVGRGSRSPSSPKLPLGKGRLD